MSAVALAMTTVSQAKAGEPLLSPRAQGSQIHTVPAANNTAAPTTVTTVPTVGALLSPRAQANQIVKVAGTNNDPDLVAALQAQSGSPKAKSQQLAPVYQIAPMK